MVSFTKRLTGLILICVLLASAKTTVSHNNSSLQKTNITGPTANRARAYIDSGAIVSAVDNYGRLSGTANPEGLRGDFQYISNLSFILGVPGKNADGVPYPWARGRKQLYSIDDNKYEFFGNDSTYWGPTVSESWFDRTPALNRTDWEAVANSQVNLFDPQTVAGKFYGARGLYTNTEDLTPLIASSDIRRSWPFVNGQRQWPGHWAIDPNDPSGTQEMEGTFVSDKDIYFEIDDRYASRDVDIWQGYPLGIKAEVSGYSYADSMAKDILIFNMNLINLSSNFYKDVYAGLYFDADIYSRLADGNYAGRSNDDDMMIYNQELNFAYIYDLDGDHDNYYVGDKTLAYCAVKLLDTPPASEQVDLDADGSADILPGDKLGLTSWHWFDWYFRPGARDGSPLGGPWSGDGQTPVADNKEEIQYKIMAGDTSALIPYDSLHYFHPGPDKLNPRFDSAEGLLTEFPDGLDCVYIMASGPFNMAPGDTVPFSFCLMMGDNYDDLIASARKAEALAENHYQWFPALKIESPVHRPSSFQLQQNYPNPFNPRTVIGYQLSVFSEVELSVYNILGQKVATLVSERQPAGQYRATWNARSFASGVYYYTLTVNNKMAQTKKMILLR